MNDKFEPFNYGNTQITISVSELRDYHNKIQMLEARLAEASEKIRKLREHTCDYWYDGECHELALKER